jgi:hypothetical protein
MNDETAKVIRQGMALIDRVWEHDRMGSASKRAYEWLWLLAGCKAGFLSIRSRDLGAAQGRTPNAAASWVKELVKYGLIKVHARPKKGTLYVEVKEPMPGESYPPPDPQLPLPLHDNAKQSQEFSAERGGQAPQPKPGETTPALPWAKPPDLPVDRPVIAPETGRITGRQTGSELPQSLQNRVNPPDLPVDRPVIAPETGRSPQEPRKQETNSSKSQEPILGSLVRGSACSSATLIIDEPPPAADRYLNQIGDLIEPSIEQRHVVRGREIDKHVTETNEQARTRIVTTVFRKVSDPKMGAHLATYAADAVLLYGLAESMLNNLLDATERKRRENSIKKTPGAYFNFRLNDLCLLHAPDCPWLKRKSKGDEG